MNAFANRSRVDYTDFDVWIIKKEDLIISKLWWAKDSHSEMQLKDVQNITRAGYHREYVDSWTQALGIAEEVQQCRREIDE